MLPVPVDQFIMQPMQYPHGQPPVHLAALQSELPPQVHQYLPMIGSLVANELSGRATMNHIRVFAFNLAAQNNWQNTFYMEAVRIAAALFLWTGQQSGVQQAAATLQHISQKAVEMFIAKCIVAFPEFQAYIDQAQYTAAMQTNGQLDSLMADISRMMSGQVGYGMPAGYGPQPAMQRPMYPPYGASPSPGYGQMGGGFSAPPTGMTGIQFGTTNRGSFSSPAAPTEAQNTESRYGGRSNTVSEPTVAVPTPKPITSTTTEQGVKKMPVLLEEATTMNRTQHTITICGVPVARSKREFLAMERLENLGMDMKPVKPDNLQVHVYDRTLIHTNMEEAIVECRVIQQQRKLDDKESRIFMSNVVIGKFFITNDDYTARLRAVVRRGTLASVAEGLRGFCQEIAGAAGNESILALNLLRYLNTRLTEFVNHYLRVELDLSISIDSFMDDAPDLQTFIVSEYGADYDRYLNDMQRIISDAFMVDMDTAEQILRESVLDGTGVCASLYLESVGITMLDMLYDELGFDLKPDVSYRIQDQHQLIKMLASKVPYDLNENKLPTHTQYLVTLDNVRLSVHRSVVSPGMYLVSLASCC